MLELSPDWEASLWKSCPDSGPANTIQNFNLTTVLQEDVHFLSSYGADGLLTGFLAYFPDGFADKIAPRRVRIFRSPR